MDGFGNSTDIEQNPPTVKEFTETTDDVISDVRSTQDEASKVGRSADDDKNLSPMSPNFEEAEHPFQYSNDTSDLRLIVEGRPLYVSRVVLSLISPVLKSLLATRDAEDTVEVQLPGKKYDDMVEFLCCVYPDILNPVTEDNITAILPLADEYQVKRLMDKCEDFLVQDIQSVCPKPRPDKIVHYLGFSEKYGFERLQKASYETAAKTESDLLENVQDFWDLPSVTTTSVFIRRLKLLEQCGKNIRAKIKELQNHCSLYHKGDRDVDSGTPVAPPLHLCKPLNSCSCQFVDDGTILDLTSLGSKAGSPFFQDVLSPDGLFYSYTPCGSFSEGKCKDASVCLKDSAGETRTIGSAVQPEFTYDEVTTETVIGYTAGDIGQTHTFVYLICDKAENPGPPRLFPNGTQDTGVYLMTIYTVCACGGGCDANGPITKNKPESGIGIGVYILIGIAAVIVLYFLIGSAIMKFGFKKSGKEIVPNSAFWCNLPTKIKDCFMWLFEKCCAGDPYTNMK